MEDKDRFYKHFHLTLANIQEEISRVNEMSSVGGERQDAIDAILSGISRLSNEVADAAEYVAAYDQRFYAQALRSVMDQLNSTTAKVAPRNRFQFHPRVTAMTEEMGSDARHVRFEGGPVKEGDWEERKSLEEQEAGKVKDYNSEIAKPRMGPRMPSFTSAKTIALSDHEGVHIILPATAAHATATGSLLNLTRCVVDMSVPTTNGSSPFASLVVRNVTRSLVVAGCVDGPAHVTGLRDSVVVVVARQLRMHECERCDFYVWCGTSPIVEECQRLRFAPAPGYYLTETEDTAMNQWDHVDDFKWLKAERSPNWCVLPEDERIGEDVWSKVVPGGPVLGVDDILKAVGIGKR